MSLIEKLSDDCIARAVLAAENGIDNIKEDKFVDN